MADVPDDVDEYVVSGASILASGRRAAEARMVCSCKIDRDGTETFNEDTLLYEDTDSHVYVGPCRLKFGMNRVASRDTESQILAAQQLILYLPVDTSTDVRVDDQVTITDGGPDPALTGRTFRITGLFSQTFATARRMPIESLS